MPAGGRYRGAGDEIALDLRVDAELNIVSGDLYAITSRPGSDEPLVGYAASFRTSPPLDASLPSAILAEDDLGGRTTGSMLLDGPAPGRGGGGAVTVTVVLDGGLNGIGSRRPMTVVAERVGDLLRPIVLEIDRERDVAEIAPVVDDGGVVRTLPGVLAGAGLDPVVDDRDDPIPVKDAGWDTAELHALMVDVADRPVDRPAWGLGLLVLGSADERQRGLLGVMFDTTPQLPRQAAAVFATAVRELRPDDADRKLMQTTVHEIGHALNLAHRFEREVGRADSFSHMAYDWRHVGGPEVFWEGYDYRFDPDELAFLRHGRRRDVIPGGAPFHSVRYWADGGGGSSPYVPEAPLAGVSLLLDPPPASLTTAGPLFGFGQPVYLQVRFRNDLDVSIEVPHQLLDHKVGLLEVLIRRQRPGDPSGIVDADAFRPVAQRCVDVDPGVARTLDPGDEMTDNLNLTFGASGFGFAEPGRYEVTALLVVPEIRDGQVVREYVAASAPLPVTIAHPVSALDEISAVELLDPEVGTWFALGGAPALRRAGDRLDALAERRGGDPNRDPVVAAIVRAQAFEALRSPIRYERSTDTFRSEPSRPELAVERLRRLDAGALASFDPSTAAGTRRLARDLEQRM